MYTLPFEIFDDSLLARGETALLVDQVVDRLHVVSPLRGRATRAQWARNLSAVIQEKEVTMVVSRVDAVEVPPLDVGSLENLGTEEKRVVREITKSNGNLRE